MACSFQRLTLQLPVTEHFDVPYVPAGIRLFELERHVDCSSWIHLGVGMTLVVATGNIRGFVIGVVAATSYCCKLSMVVWDGRRLLWAYLVTSRLALSQFSFAELVTWCGCSPHWVTLDPSQVYFYVCRLLHGSSRSAHLWCSFLRLWGDLWNCHLEYVLDSADLVYSIGPLCGTLVSPIGYYMPSDLSEL